MKAKLLFFVIIIAALVLTACAPAAPESSVPEVCASDELGCAVIPDGETIKIGMGGPMTGDYAMFGIDISQGAQVAFDQQKGVDKWKFELVVEDTQAAPETGAAVANKFVSDPTFVAIAGHVFSGETEAAMPIYEKAGLPMLSASATNPPLTTLGSKVFNRIAFTDATQAAAAADVLFNKLGMKNIAVMHDGSTYGQGLADLTKVEFEKLGGTVVAYEGVTPGETDYSAILSAVADKKPEAIYFGGYIAEAVVIVNQMDQSGLEGVTFFGCDGTFGSEFIEKTGANGEGDYAASLVPPESAEKDAFDVAYKEKYGEDPGVLSAYTWSAFDIGNALMEQVAKVAVVGGDGNLYIPRSTLVTTVRTMKDVKAITGNITCSDTGECNTAGPILYTVKDQAWQVVD